MKTPIKKMTFKYIKVPIEALEQSGIDNTKPMEFYVHEGMIIMKNVTDADGDICYKDCDGCPLEEIECNYERKE